MPIKILNLLLELKVGLNSVVVVEKEDIFMRIPLLRRPVRHGALKYKTNILHITSK